LLLVGLEEASLAPQSALENKQGRLGMLYPQDRVANQGMVSPTRLSADCGASEASSNPTKSNSLAPFSTVGKPTCGYFFSRDTNNRKIKFGIPPCDNVKWRNFPTPSNTAGPVQS